MSRVDVSLSHRLLLLSSSSTTLAIILSTLYRFSFISLVRDFFLLQFLSSLLHSFSFTSRYSSFLLRLVENVQWASEELVQSNRSTSPSSSIFPNIYNILMLWITYASIKKIWWRFAHSKYFVGLPTHWSNISRERISNIVQLENQRSICIFSVNCCFYLLFQI